MRIKKNAVSQLSGLTADICSLCLQIGDDAEQALDLLEKGRATIMGDLIDKPSGFSGLEAAYPDQAAQYNMYPMSVNYLSREMSGFNEDGKVGKRHLKAVHELENCIENIRQLPEFHRFLLGPPKREFKEAAREGPIAVVNITDIRSDAIIISTCTIKAIRLPELRSSSEARGWIQQNLTFWKMP